MLQHAVALASETSSASVQALISIIKDPDQGLLPKAV